MPRPSPVSLPARPIRPPVAPIMPMRRLPRPPPSSFSSTSAIAASASGIAWESAATSSSGPSLAKNPRIRAIALRAVSASIPVAPATRLTSSSMASCSRSSRFTLSPSARPKASKAGQARLPSIAGANPPRAGRIMAQPEKADPTDVPGKILVGKSGKSFQYLTLGFGNRHGLVTGATGTGKTVTLQLLAEGFSNAGTPVFAADVKGDLSGIGMAGDGKSALTKRAAEIGIPYAPDRFPVVFWDIFGEQGHPVRATISEMGPLLVAQLLELNDTQEGVLNIVFRIADEQGLLILDLKDLRAVLQYAADNASDLTTKYGNVAPATIGTIQRRLLVLENQGADKFFGEPALDISDFLKTDRDGRGIVNVLAAEKLMRSPRLYATFLLWLLSELFEQLPEVGDPDKPKLVFFFDEAHLLFDNAPKPLMDAIEQVVRLIRSKGVGVYFVTQNPLDVPEVVLGQLGNRVQHALRAFTPRDQRAVKAAAETFRQNPAFDTGKAITELAVGQALVSMLEGKGTPAMVTRDLIAPPA